MQRWTALCYIWGLHGIAAGLVDVASIYWPVGRTTFVLTLAAFALSLLALPLFGGSDGTRRYGSASRVAGLIAALLGAGSVALLLYAGRADLFALELLRGLLLAVMFALIGMYRGGAFVWLGVWLFALCAVVALRYLGFAPLVLQGLGGAGLAACGWLLQRSAAAERGPRLRF
ncbi:MAG: hypothetical protein J7639_18265 [Paenibacillaceae bacterium]|nr:hypothetical protein [Paenibacillaceae bacterium]